MDPPFILFFTPQGCGWSRQPCLRVNWDLSDPSEALTSPQTPAVGLSVWTPPPSSYHHGLLKCQSQTACYQRPHSHPSAQPEQRRDLLHLGAIRRLHSWRIPLRENRLVLHFPIATPPPPKNTAACPDWLSCGSKTTPRPPPTFPCPTWRAWTIERWRSQNTRAHSPLETFFLLKKTPLKAIHTEGRGRGGVMNMLLCAAVTVLRHTSVSGVLAFLLIGPISEKNKKKKCLKCTIALTL